MALAVVAAFAAGVLVGQRAVESDGPVVVGEMTPVIRELTIPMNEELRLADVPVRLVESWADNLVSSDPTVVEVLDDQTILGHAPGIVDLTWVTDAGPGRPLYRVTVEEPGAEVRHE